MPPIQTMVMAHIFGAPSGTVQGLPPTFLADYLFFTLVNQVCLLQKKYITLMKDGEFVTCLDDILVKIKQLSEAKKCMISEIITLCKLLVNPATSAAGERSFSSAWRLKTWLCSTMTQTRFNSNLTILNMVPTSKEQTNFVLQMLPMSLELSIKIEKATFGTFKESDLKMST